MKKSQPKLILASFLNGCAPFCDPVVLVPCERTESQLAVGLAYLVGSDQKSVNVMSVSSEGLLDRVSEFAGKIQINVLCDGCKWSSISSGIFEKWLPAKSKLWLQKTSSAQLIRSHGLNEANGTFGSQANGTISIQSDQLFWVGEEY